VSSPHQKTEPFALDLLLTDDQRHAEWQIQLAEKQAFSNELVAIHGLLDDEDFDGILQADPYISGTNNRRSDKELAHMLDLIDNLPISDAGKEGSH